MAATAVDLSPAERVRAVAALREQLTRRLGAPLLVGPAPIRHSDLRLAKPVAPERERLAWALVQRCAAELKARGASRVVLFGSLAVGNFGPHSDVDLAVQGLTGDQYWGALDLCDLGDAAGMKIDLVSIERASPRLLKWVERDGVEV